MTINQETNLAMAGFIIGLILLGLILGYFFGMETGIGVPVVILIGVGIYATISLCDFQGYRDAKIQLHNEVVAEGKEMRKKAEADMAKQKCKKGGNCNFILEDKTVEHLPGWDDLIEGHYVCNKCGKRRTEVLQYPN